MADSSNVTPIRPAPPSEPSSPRKRAKLQRFASVEEMLGAHQDTVYSARAVASLLANQLRDLRGCNVHELEKLIRAADAIAQLLAPVEGIDSFEDLAAQHTKAVQMGRTRGW